MDYMGEDDMGYTILTNPLLFLMCLLSLPLLVAASIASVPGCPWASWNRPLRIMAVVATCLAIAVVVARFVVMGS